MKKILLGILALIFLQGCGPTASIVSTGITIAKSGSATKAVAASGSGLFIKKKTGKQPIEHIADNTINAELRNCSVTHSAEINQIFFTTLDEFDCKKSYLNEANLYYLR
tara:strand:+ start:358 stop:684 length:327 start_codon:yes stop_codon:yes gene_type:complete